jgi:RHS repeat-associated protein
MCTLHDFGESYIAYASAYFVENNNGYTKHYYAGATRLVSKLGEGYYENNELVSTGKEEKEQYFYFQDHLGSSTYITDLNGDIAQYSAYTPYGEMFREYRNVTPYRFNGKELDTETGLYYYGARYYNPTTTLWLGVDPLASKYPGVSPYVYCMSNPVKYVDPDGRWCDDVSDWTENSNVRKAINESESNGGRLYRWTGQNGYTWASVQTVSVEPYSEPSNEVSGSFEFCVTAKVYPGNKQNQHNPVWNFAEELESDLWIANGHSHGGGTTWVDYTTPEDKYADCGVISTVAGVISFGAVTSIGEAIIPVLGLVNSIDDIRSYASGENFSMENVYYKIAKDVVSGLSFISNFTNDPMNTVQKINSVVSITNDIINFLIKKYDKE